MTETTYAVTGMTCEHCARSVTEEVAKISGVTKVDVDLAGGAVTVTSESAIDDADVHAAVDEAGYAVAS
ncbi:heavy-metal-associated domain-containing protein [Amycolatopsis lurida]|uniref:heavy-metal-associated domain-containing protein n=1 Tax=Amycolatopsis sp. YIM 10 TaxID=2653857 RepID=UPI0012906278|nr:heavy-metal-associated domain-containing protein [Amycolatopsis sp. YIM 10]QFU86583.1 Copper chaperone CopZ [Amycolatopsis sp. YIM 10]